MDVWAEGAPGGGRCKGAGREAGARRVCPSSRGETGCPLRAGTGVRRGSRGVGGGGWEGTSGTRSCGQQPALCLALDPRPLEPRGVASFGNGTFADVTS